MLNVIDLSHNNTLTDDAFHQFQSVGIQAVLHKATQGLTMDDPAFADRKARAAEIGMPFGAYHFATGDDPIAQAEHFLAVTQGTLCRVLDWEQLGMTYTGAVAFVNAIYRASGRYPMLYSGSAFLQEQLTAQGVTTSDTTTLSRCPLWIARYGVAPNIPMAWAAWTLWQYSQTGTVPGVLGNCDQDYFNGNQSALNLLFS